MIKLTMPIKDEEIRDLKVGDTVFLTWCDADRTGCGAQMDDRYLYRRKIALQRVMTRKYMMRSNRC